MKAIRFDRIVKKGIKALGGGTTHRASSSGSGHSASRTGNPGTGNRRPGMRRRTTG